MKLKYYLRGLGIGVIVTTIIMAIALERKPQALTDAQIKARAAELGMVEENLVKDDNDAAVSGEALAPGTQEAVGAEKNTQPPSGSNSASTSATTEPSKKTTTEPSKKTTTQATQAPHWEETEDGTYITIEIGASDWSNHVASKLEAAGLVESAADFDRYLVQNGYESIIASGTHRFKVGSTYEELARELVNR